MTTVETGFYITGGALRGDAPSYVRRQADEDLYDGLQRGQFCYVLTSRQMGKSSLMVHTAERLRQQGVAVVVLDLTAIGQNLTAEQWYEGLLSLMGQQLKLEGELEDFWLAQERLGPLQRWLRALREVSLTHIKRPLVIFIDEIDAARSLPFSTDEFFAGIRELYNARTEDAELSRLTFCLVGVATPSDLIRDTRTTPFNIGRRIELSDFTEDEAMPLARGLGHEAILSRALLKRVLYWTGGHPYLTQRLCQAIAGDPSIRDVCIVDRRCSDLFFSTRARERDDNLLFVRERLLRSEADLASLLDLYRQVRRNKRVSDDERNPLLSILRLSGIAQVMEGELKVRNRVYARVFDQEWIAANMPDAELRRQRVAYRKGVLFATGIATVLIALLFGLIITVYKRQEDARRADLNLRKANLTLQEIMKAAEEAEQKKQQAISQTDIADQQRAEAERRMQEATKKAGEQFQVALDQAKKNRYSLYMAQMSHAQQALESANSKRAIELLEGQKPKLGQEDLRGFEWYYLWRLCHTSKLVLNHTNVIKSLAFSQAGKLAVGGGDGVAKLLDTVTGQTLVTLKEHAGEILTVAFSPDGRKLATGSADSTVRLWDVATGQKLTTLTGHDGEVLTAAFSPDGKKLATGSGLGGSAIKIWEVTTGQELATFDFEGGDRWINSVAFSPDGKRLAIGSRDKSVKLWDVVTNQEQATLNGHELGVTSVAFSPDGKLLATGSSDATVKLWDVSKKQELNTFKGHKIGVCSVVFSPDGKWLATSGTDQTVKLWDVGTGEALDTLFEHTGEVGSIAFSPDGKWLATGSLDRTVRLWAVGRQQELNILRGHKGSVRLAFSPDGKRLATGSGDHTVKLWEVATGRELFTLKGHSDGIQSVAFSPDGKKLATGGNDHTVKLWDLTKGHEMMTLKGHTEEVTAVAFSFDGTLLATTSVDKTIRLWNLNRGEELAALKGHSDYVLIVAFSPDGKYLATGSGDRSVKLWDVANKQEINTLKGHTDLVWAAAFSPDGELLATAGRDNTVKLWDMATKQELATLKGHSSDVNSVAFSPDGKRLASGSSDRTVKLWDIVTRQELVTLKGHAQVVVSVAFSPDGKTLASGGSVTGNSINEGTARLWRAASDIVDFPKGKQSRTISATN
jgi:WD40 repeat protein